MFSWSIITEVVAFLLIFVLILNLSFSKRTLTPIVKWFWAGLISAAISIIWNILCVFLLRSKDQVPRSLNIFMNTGYFILIVLTCSIIAMYLFEKMLEHVYDKHCIKRARFLLVLLTSSYFVLTLVNLKTGFLFWFDEGGNYCRGIFNGIGYWIMLAEFALLSFCYFKHHASVSKDMMHVMRTVPPVILLIVIIQLRNPETLLNGTIIAFTEVILFVSFYNQKRDTDSVTGLGNRYSFFSELNLKIKRRQEFQIILISLADFGVINCRYGHQMGDEFLYSVADWLDKTFKQAAAFRYVGVTYAVMLPYTGWEQAEICRQRLIKRFQEPWEIAGKVEVLPAAFGDFIYSRNGIDANQVIEVLDYIMSLAKRSAHKWVRFDDVVAEKLLRYRRVADCLRKAVADGALEVWYQPVYSRREQRFLSAEALVRMKDEEGSFVSPSEFIPIAEEIGLVDRIFWFVLEEVCGFLKADKSLPLKSISVNLSMPQFEDPRLLEKVRDLIDRYGIPIERIKFEITEREISDDAAMAGETVRRMVKEGFCFYLDDFGTGYSNFSSVAQFNFECVKLDKSLVDVVQSDQKSYKLIQGLVRLFHGLGIQVIAEGTETREQVECLMDLDADQIQGYYYAKPMPGERLREVLEQQVQDREDEGRELSGMDDV
ncbi:EAL domain-containing protein [Clostridium sp. MCC353]|uniref:bifunctional diguanylate cyclase/phosphodiesterase n=1 Tax=Clostridium sp. MCC353 TaxID=2592646 RepID=UPI001C02204A|nr:bifunctional diguanylate cyclase/phosphodiesterase [Clostridium sp. MCC353]MBT9775756.1 EAL domain-containing protein [Clostridium sp. MCC353]